MSFSSFWMVIHDDRTYLWKEESASYNLLPSSPHFLPHRLVPSLFRIFSWSWFEKWRNTFERQCEESIGKQSITLIFMTDPRVWFEPIHVSFQITRFSISSMTWYQIEKSVVFNLLPCESLTRKLSSTEMMEEAKKHSPKKGYLSPTLNSIHFLSKLRNQGINYYVKHSLPNLFLDRNSSLLSLKFHLCQEFLGCESKLDTEVLLLLTSRRRK